MTMVLPTFAQWEMPFRKVGRNPKVNFQDIIQMKRRCSKNIP